MSLKQYTNIEEILNADKSISAQRLEKKSSDLLSFPINKHVDFNVALSPEKSRLLELHIYANDVWITGNHTVQVTNESATFTNTDTNEDIQFNGPILNIDLFNQFNNLKLTSGNYRFVINFFENLIGSYALQYLKVDEISPDRTEVRLKAIDKKNSAFLQQINRYINTVNQTALPGLFAKTYLLNFGRNQTVQYVNSVVIGEFLYVKLLNPLPDTIEDQFKCWVVKENKYPYIDNVIIYPKDFIKTFSTLSGPNWQANNQPFNVSAETGLKNWNDLLGSSAKTSQEIVDAYFSGSLTGIDLNIDYTDFNNFIFYSSATNRVENFKYKLELIELYNSQSAAVSLLSGSVPVTNVSDLDNKIDKLVGGFDKFEQFLYYQSSSGLYTHPIPLENPNVAEKTGSYITPAEKSNTSYPYDLYSVSSSNFTSWYTDLHANAELYDSRNLNSLIKAVPQFILLDQENTQLSLFVNMLGQHYDILYTYINAMSKINKREEHPHSQYSIPNELLYSVAKQFGWNLQDGNQYKNLWEYTLGTNETGAPLTGSNSVYSGSLSGRDMTYTVWRRIVNNIPGLLKSKGTKRSVQALLACYGVPQSLITIKEYGGPRLERPPLYEKLNFDYALDLIRNPAGRVTTGWTAATEQINSVELRFRTDNVLTNPTMSTKMNLYTMGAAVLDPIQVDVEFTGGTLGTININGTASAAFECFDGGWVNTLLRTGSSGTVEIIAKKSKYGKIVATVSASATGSMDLTAVNALTLGGAPTTYPGGAADRLEGELQELRLWSSILNAEPGIGDLDDPFTNHTKAPAAYDGNIDAYDELLFRLPLTQKINHTLTSSMFGVQPNPSSDITSVFVAWTNDIPYDSIEETYYYDGISLGAGTFDDNKIRLESNNLVGALDVITRAERSQFDIAPLDSKKLGVYYSPQTMINEDIIAQLGFQSLDDYIGDPGDQNSRSYPDLIRVATEYWKKYTTKNDINAYIKIFSLFDLSFFKQLEQLLPARADKILGLLVQPNLLERSKDVALPAVNKFLESYEGLLTSVVQNVDAQYLVYTGSIAGAIATMTAIDDDQLQAYLTSSQNNYDGTTYCYPYLIRSGSGWLQVSSPYWSCEGVLPTITGSRLSEIYEYVYSGSVMRPAEVQDYLPIGTERHEYLGCKMTSPDFNIDSTDTIDGGPVVEYIEANPNQIITQAPGQQGGLEIK